VIKCDYFIHLKLCSDQNSKTGILKEAIGKKDSLFMINNIPTENSNQNREKGLAYCTNELCKWQIKANRENF